MALRNHTVIFLIASLYHSITNAATNEVFPGDFDLAEPNTHVLAVYYYKRELIGLYANGQRITQGKVNGHAEVLAYTYYTTTQNLLSAWTINIPYIGANASGEFPDGFGESFSGFSDPRISYTIWPINTGKHAFAISGTIIPPIGSYDKNQIINAGDHRWKQVAQFAWVYKPTSTLTLDLVPEISFYGDNHDFVGSKLEQQPSYALTSYLRYAISPYAEAQVGFQLNNGGNQTIDGVSQHNAPEANRYYLGASMALSKQLAIGLRYSQDTSVQNDLKTTSDWVLRAYWFY